MGQFFVSCPHHIDRVWKAAPGLQEAVDWLTAEAPQDSPVEMIAVHSFMLRVFIFLGGDCMCSPMFCICQYPWHIEDYW